MHVSLRAVLRSLAATVIPSVAVPPPVPSLPPLP